MITKDTDALQQLQTGNAYFTDSPVAGLCHRNPEKFEVVGQIIEPIVGRIALPCNAEDAPARLTPVGLAVESALDHMIAEGPSGYIGKVNLAKRITNKQKC